MTQPLQYKDFSNFDNIVKETIRQFLPAEALTSSSATNKFFKKMMEDKETWVKVAKQLNIQPKSPATAKNEVITRLRTNQRFLQIFEKSLGKDASELKKLSAIEQNNSIPERFKTYLFEARICGQGLTPSLDRYFEDTIKRITEKSGTKEGVDPVDMEIARMFIRQGNPFFQNQQAWKKAFASVVGVKENPDRTYSYCPEHLVLFEELIKALKEISYIEDEDKEEIVKKSFPYVWIDSFPRDINFPFNFIEAAFRSGLVRAESCFHYAQLYCPFDLWDKKEGSPITQLLKHASTAEKSRVLQQSQNWLASWKTDFFDCLNMKRYLDRLPKCLHRIIHWPVFIAFIQGREVLEKQRQENIEWVNKQIDEAGAQSTDKQFFRTIRTQVKELIQK